jgi:cytosine deaminase
MAAHLDAVCGLAREFAAPLDLHADFGIAPEASALPLVAAKVREYGLGGRTLIGHCTTLARLPPNRRDALARDLADSGVALVSLPRTDLYLDGAVAPLEALAACGLPCYLATNNVQNPFTPVGEPSLPAVAQLYALVARLGSRHQLDALACSLWRARVVIEPAWREQSARDFCLWDCHYPWQIVARGLAPAAVITGTRLLVDRLGAVT